jgi:hypothetical protein
MSKQMLTEGAFDLLLIYQFIKRISTPFDKQEAYKLGIIDNKGEKLKDPETKEEKNAYGYLDRLIFNLKKLIEKVPGGKSRLGSFAAALYLIREGHENREYSMQELQEGLEKTMSELDENTMKTFKDLMEEAPANASGSAVAGTGDDSSTVVVKKKKKTEEEYKLDARNKNVREFLRKYLNGKSKRDGLKELKKKREILARFGLGDK